MSNHPHPHSRSYLTRAEIEIQQALLEDSTWLKRYPTFAHYMSDILHHLGLDGANLVDLQQIYSDEIPPEDVVALWEVYKDNEIHC
jgi:hypothetical protein